MVNNNVLSCLLKDGKEVNARQQRKSTTQEHWEKNLEKETWMVGVRYSWRKMEVTAQDRAEWSQVVCDL